MISLYAKALLKKADKPALRQFKAPPLSQRIYSGKTVIDASHYARYCDLTGWENAEVMHPLYLQMLSLPLQIRSLTDKKSPFPLMGLIHTQNDVKRCGDIDIAAELEMRVKISRIVQHNRGWECELQLNVIQQGKTVLEAHSRYLYKIKASHVVPKAGGESGAVHKQIHHHEETPIVTIAASRNIGRRYARLSGDYNPIHLSRASALVFGFRKPLAHGMWSLARLISELEKNELFAASEFGMSLRARFKSPWFIPGSANLLRADQDSFMLATEAGETLVTCMLE